LEVIPQRELYTGALMPGIGLGTFGSDHAAPDEVAEAVRGAYEVGYRAGGGLSIAVLAMASRHPAAISDLGSRGVVLILGRELVK